ncbi:MAG: type II toxin-antitoxin system HipA family toxin [Bacteroidetes bacterium]|nr:type II toxin-antitoxin system HipA family toxin [Bacteroidota bacterium]
MVDYAYVKIWGELVGVVRWDQSERFASFQYDTKFLAEGYDLSPLKMPLRSGNRIYSFPELRPGRIGEPDSFSGLPGLLADALPDKYGNQLIDVWLAQEGRPKDSMNPVEKLCFIGTRGMGALEFEPAQLKATKQAFTIEIKSLVDMAQKMLSKREEFETNLQADEQKAMMEILKIGTSAGGARPKAVIAYNQKTGEVKSGQAKAPKGFEHWLIKLDGVGDAQFGESQGWGRVEMAYYLMAKDCGIEMTECQLLEERDRAHFMTKRFDREGNETKHHVQTLCAIQHFDFNNIYGYSYEQLFQTMRMLKLSYPEAEQMFRRMVFNVLAVNYDDHTKNFGFILKKGENWKLAPAYDVCYSYDPKNRWVSQQTLSINGKHKNILKDDLMKIALTNKLRKADKIIEEIQNVVVNWSAYAKKTNVSSERRDNISKTLKPLK